MRIGYVGKGFTIGQPKQQKSLSLTVTRIRDIEVLRKEGKTVKEIAELLGMKTTSVSKLIRNNCLK